jgi:type I restriction enzyme S subunit
VALERWGRAADATSAKTRFLRGDVLFGKLRPYFQKVVPAPVAGVASTDILVIRPAAEAWRWFTFGHAFSDVMIAHATASSDGTKMPRTRWSDLCRFPLAVPDLDTAASFHAKVDPLYRRIWANTDSSRTLATLRDALLPRLLSGELRPPEVEQAVIGAL